MVQERDTLEAAEQIAGADVESIRPLDARDKCAQALKPLRLRIKRRSNPLPSPST